MREGEVPPIVYNLRCGYANTHPHECTPEVERLDPVALDRVMRQSRLLECGSVGRDRAGALNSRKC